MDFTSEVNTVCCVLTGLRQAMTLTDMVVPLYAVAKIGMGGTLTDGVSFGAGVQDISIACDNTDVA